MWPIVARRLSTGVVTLLLVTLLVFVLIQMSAVDPFGEGLEAEGLRRLSSEDREELRKLYHLDQPLYQQYALWLRDASVGELGRSFHDRRPVTEKIAQRFGISLALNSLSLLLMVAISIPLGALAAFRPNSIWDRLTATTGYLLYAVPLFWAGLLLQIVFAVRLGWFPLYGLVSENHESLTGWSSFMDRCAHLALPVLCLSYGGVAYLSRFVRATLIDNLGIEITRAARARGLSHWAVIMQHGFRQAAVPMLTLAGLLLPTLVGGSVIVEMIFAIPGLGRLFVEAAFRRDVPVLMGLTLISGAATLLGVIAADLAYAWADPRVRRG